MDEWMDRQMGGWTDRQTDRERNKQNNDGRPQTNFPTDLLRQS